jgi:hypothetical protein
MHFDARMLRPAARTNRIAIKNGLDEAADTPHRDAAFTRTSDQRHQKR